MAIVFALVIANFFKGFFPPLPGEHLATYHVTTEHQNFMQTLLDMVPTNFLSPLMKDDMIPVIFIAIITGIGILEAKEKGEVIGNIIIDAEEVVMKIMGIIIKFTPIGVFCLIADVIAVNGAHFLGTLAIIIGVLYLSYLLHLVIVYFSGIKLLCKMSPIAFIKGLYPAMICAFTTTSSNATLPLTMKCCNEMGAKKEVSSFVLPLGATINMDGTAIYQAITTVFIACCYAIDLSFADMATIVFAALFASIGTGGVTGSGMIMLAMVLSSVGIPVEGIAIVAGIDKVLNMGRAALNVTGDAICTLWVSRLEQSKEEKVTKKEALVAVH